MGVSLGITIAFSTPSRTIRAGFFSGIRRALHSTSCTISSIWSRDTTSMPSRPSSSLLLPIMNGSSIGTASRQFRRESDLDQSQLYHSLHTY
jgi:hypothetical protein